MSNLWRTNRVEIIGLLICLTVLISGLVYLSC
jgi:hypothetical protein